MVNRSSFRPPATRSIRDVREANSFGRSAVRNWVYLLALVQVKVFASLKSPRPISVCSSLA